MPFCFILSTLSQKLSVFLKRFFEIVNYSRILFLLLVWWHLSAYPQNSQRPMADNDSSAVIPFDLSMTDYSLNLQKFPDHFDTSARYFHIYNPLQKNNSFRAQIGNIALASQNMVFSSKSSLTDYSQSLAFLPYLNSDHAVFFFSLKPFTELFYSFGYKREQNFRVRHLHHVRNRLYFGVNYQIINAPGRDYFRQKSNNHILSAYSYYSTKNQKYGFFAFYDFSRIKNQENGGLVDDTIYLNFRKGDKTEVPKYFLAEAENFIKETGFGFKQYLSVGKANKNHTVDSVEIKKNHYAGRLIHDFDLDFNTYRFSNGINNGFFPLIPFDTVNTLDSVKIIQVMNKIQWINDEFDKRHNKAKVRYSLSVRHIYTEIKPINYRYYLNDVAVVGGASYQPVSNLTFKLSSEYLVYGNSINNFSVNFSGLFDLFFKDRDFGQINFSLGLMKKQPDWVYLHFHSKYYNWDNSFSDERIFNAGLKYSFRKLHVKIDYYNIRNYTFLNLFSVPEQNGEKTVNILNVDVRKKFIIKWFELDNLLIYQITDRNDILRKPDVIARQSYVFSFHLFKRALFVQTGLDLTYNTRYYANAYNPALRMFYLQTNRMVGNYLYADYFINLKIKRFRIFASLNNFLSGLIGYDSFMVPHYPMQDRVFKLGLSWVFHD